MQRHRREEAVRPVRSGPALRYGCHARSVSCVCVCGNVFFPPARYVWKRGYCFLCQPLVAWPFPPVSQSDMPGSQGSPVRARAWGVGSGPGWGVCERLPVRCFSLSLSPSLPVSLKRKQIKRTLNQEAEYLNMRSASLFAMLCGVLRANLTTASCVPGLVPCHGHCFLFLN